MFFKSMQKVSLLVMLVAATSAHAGWFTRSPREEILTPEQQKQKDAREKLVQIIKMLNSVDYSDRSHEQKCMSAALALWFDDSSLFKNLQSVGSAVNHCEVLPASFISLLIDALAKDERGKVVVNENDLIDKSRDFENNLKYWANSFSINQPGESCKLLKEFLIKQIPLHEADYQKRVAELKAEFKKKHEANKKKQGKLNQELDEILNPKK